jgi:hypothetical protein
MTAVVAEDPRLIETPTGWLAVTVSGNYPRIGVSAATEQEARQMYSESRDSWLALLNMEPQVPADV